MMVTEEPDKDKEVKHVKQALTSCGYPQWAFEKVKGQIQNNITKIRLFKYIEILTSKN